MPLTVEEACPACDAEEFYRAASTRLQLGTKVKWHCAECEFGYVTIDGISSKD